MRSFNLLWSLSALWFITALFALQFAPLTAADPDQDTALINSALQNQLALLPHAPLERSSGAALAAPVRAILTPVLHFSNKPLPDSGNNSFTLVKIDGLSINYHSAYHVVLLPAADFLPAVAAADARAPPLSFS